MPPPNRRGGVVPAHLQLDAPWNAIRAARAAAKQAGHDFTPTLLACWCLTRAMEKHPAFHGQVQPNGSIAVLPEFDLGVTVLHGTSQVIAAIPRANRLDWADFTVAYSRAVAAARTGQASDSQAPLVLTSVGAMGIEMATSVVVPPAVATLVLGRTHLRMVAGQGVIAPVEVATLSLTFDHRVVNGVGAAAFLQEVKSLMTSFSLPDGKHPGR